MDIDDEINGGRVESWWGGVAFAMPHSRIIGQFFSKFRFLASIFYLFFVLISQSFLGLPRLIFFILAYINTGRFPASFSLVFTSTLILQPFAFLCLPQ